MPTSVARRVRALAKSRKTSTNRVLVALIEVGLQSRDAEKDRFFSLVNRLTQSRDSAEDLCKLKVWRETQPDARRGLGIRTSDRSRSVGKVSTTSAAILVRAPTE
jgi:hypothetical protein